MCVHVKGVNPESKAKARSTGNSCQCSKYRYQKRARKQWDSNEGAIEVVLRDNQTCSINDLGGLDILTYLFTFMQQGCVTYLFQVTLWANASFNLWIILVEMTTLRTHRNRLSNSIGLTVQTNEIIFHVEYLGNLKIYYTDVQHNYLEICVSV